VFLYLTRHGVANSKDVDPDQRLSTQGVEEVKRLAQYLGNFGILRILHSTKKRAEQTAMLFAEVACIAPQEVSDLDPMDSPSVWASKIMDMEDDIMLVGHLPFLDHMASLLLHGKSDEDAFEFEPGSVMCLHREDGQWRMKWFLSPSLIAS
jgi:phosphohistidine phosphatase